MSVVYYTAKWCGPCKVFRPLAEKILNEERVSFSVSDVDEEPLLAELNRVMSLPTIIFQDSKTGTEVGRVVGASEKQLRQQLATWRNLVGTRD